MHLRQLVLRGLIYYWRTNLAVVLGVAAAVSVLGGALLVGDSVRGSLRDLVLGRLGRTDQVIVTTGLFREGLAAALAAQAEFTAGFDGVVPLLTAQGMVTDQATGRRAWQVRIYGVDDRFWQFHGLGPMTGPAARAAYLSPALARRIEATEGAAVLVRVERPTDVPIESLHGRRDNLGRTLRLTVERVLAADALGEFSLDIGQGEVLAAFVPLARLQDELEVPGRVNTLLVAAGPRPPPDAVEALHALIRREATLDDLGLDVELLEPQRVVTVGSRSGLLDDDRAAAAQQAIAGTAMRARPLFTYLANTIRVGTREIPYSLVTALPLDTIGAAAAPGAPALAAAASRAAGGESPRAAAEPASAAEDPIVLSSWAADELNARPGDLATIDYYVWEDPGQLVTRTATLRVAGIVPLDRGDRRMAPVYPGISDSPTLDDWDPPFPVDLRRVRPADERYWEQYRTTPKAFIPLETGQRLWRSRHGAMTSLRVSPAPGQDLETARDVVAARLRAAADPVALGLAAVDLRAQGLAASRGATDFGEYFVYFSFFIVVSALLLAALFFKLGIEQRIREVGLLRAVGAGPRQVRRLFLMEGLVLAAAGSAIGLVGALAYAALMMHGLRSWWVDAVGTTALALHVSPLSLLGGAIGGVLAAVACIWWTLRALDRVSERSLLSGQLDGSLLETPASPPSSARGRRWGLPALTLAAASVAAGLLAAAAAGGVSAAAGFFGAGALLLVALLAAALLLLRRRSGQVISGHGWVPVSRLGMRNATYRPGRSVLSIAVIAAATFILIAVDAFRRGDRLIDTGPGSGVGGYSLIVDTLLPVAHDPNTREGRDALNLGALDGDVVIEPFRVLPGDDASCLNLYAPGNPRIVAPSRAFVEQGRFAFASARTSTEAERANPWLLLERMEPDGAIPVIGDLNSMTYVLHKAIGDDIVLSRGGRDIRLRLVAALRDSIFQGELLMGQDHFVRTFPDQQGYRMLLVRGGGPTAGLARIFEDALADFGATMAGTEERLARFHRVENTYLSTFQALGGLGLLLGTVGLAAVLLRNVLERRRELALLGAVGYRRAHVVVMVVAEHALLIIVGLAVGAVSAGLAIAPAVAERGGRLPVTGGGAALLFAVLATGVVSSIIAMRVATRAPLLASLRAE